MGTLLFLIAAILAACAAPTVAGTTSTDNGINVFRTPNPNDASPTPTFPPFTVGAWPSNYSPANNEHMTIYVLCKSQPKNQSGPAAVRQRHPRGHLRRRSRQPGPRRR